MNKKYRLRKNYEFNYVYRRGTGTPCREMVLYSAKNGRSDKILVGFSAGKKIGGSVCRNRAKRLMREAFRSLFDQVRPGYNYIVCARSGISDADFETVRKSLKYMLKKSGKLL